MKFVLNLKDAVCHDRNKVGGKAAILSRLGSLGYCVPDGFVIPVMAVDNLFSRPELYAKAIFSKEIFSEVKSLPAPWIVRSSCTSEDSIDVSFAGVFKSIQGVINEDELYVAVKEVVSSRYSEFSRLYARASGVSSDEIDMAVIIQEFIEPTCGGVIFSRDPIDLGNFIVIEASQTPSNVVNGSIKPALIVLKPQGESNSLNSADVIAGENETFEIVESSLNNENVVSDKLISELARISRELEKKLGAPQDIEWVATTNNIYILQARPITTRRTINDYFKL